MITCANIYAFYTYRILLALGCSMMIKAAAPLDPGQPFRDFLSERPAVKEIVFGESLLRYRRVRAGEPAETPDGPITYAAGVQGESFYLKALSNALFGAAFMSNGVVIGQSTDRLWKLMESKTAFADPNDRARHYAMNVLYQEVDQARHTLERTLALGIEHLIPGTLKWSSESAFKAQSSSFGVLKGTVVEASGGLPSRISIVYEKLPDVVRYVSYVYEKGSFPPTQLIQTMTQKGRTTELGTNVIYSLVLGEMDPGFKGYLPTQFTGPAAKPPPRVTWSKMVLAAVLFGILVLFLLHAAKRKFVPH